MLALIPVDITYSELSPPHSALIHHRHGILLPPHLHPYRRHTRPHTRRHYRFPGQTSRVQSRVIDSRWHWGWHLAHRVYHLQLRDPRCPLAS